MKMVAVEDFSYFYYYVRKYSTVYSPFVTGLTQENMAKKRRRMTRRNWLEHILDLFLQVGGLTAKRKEGRMKVFLIMQIWGGSRKSTIPVLKQIERSKDVPLCIRSSCHSEEYSTNLYVQPRSLFLAKWPFFLFLFLLCTQQIVKDSSSSLAPTIWRCSIRRERGNFAKKANLGGKPSYVKNFSPFSFRGNTHAHIHALQRDFPCRFTVGQSITQAQARGGRRLQRRPRCLCFP